MTEEKTPKLYGMKDTKLDEFIKKALGQDYYDLVKKVEFHEFDLDEMEVDDYEISFRFSRSGIKSLGDFSFGREILDKVDRVYVCTQLNKEDDEQYATVRVVVTIKQGGVPT